MSSDHFYIQEHVIASQHVREYPGATTNSQEDVLQLHIKQYTPLDSDPASSDAVTIIGAHANGFPKVLGSYCKSKDVLMLLSRSCTNPFGTNYIDGRNALAFPYGLYG